MSKKLKSTHDEFLESLNPKQRREYEEEFREFLLSELLMALMEENEKSVRELAKAAHVSPTIIQGLRSGSRKNLTVQTLHDILSVFGYILVAEKASELKNRSRIKIASLDEMSENTFKIGFRR
jgi:transcriptional regulator with XRE-family HTH domain